MDKEFYKTKDDDIGRSIDCREVNLGISASRVSTYSNKNKGLPLQSNLAATRYTADCTNERWCYIKGLMLGLMADWLGTQQWPKSSWTWEGEVNVVEPINNLCPYHLGHFICEPTLTEVLEKDWLVSIHRVLNCSVVSDSLQPHGL